MKHMKKQGYLLSHDDETGVWTCSWFPPLKGFATGESPQGAISNYIATDTDGYTKHIRSGDAFIVSKDGLEWGATLAASGHEQDGGDVWFRATGKTAEDAIAACNKLMEEVK